MKRGWFGAALLLVLLALGLSSSFAMGAFHEPMAQSLEQASQDALAGNWEQAIGTAQQVRDRWERLWHYSAIFADHEPMEQIDALFAQMAVYQETGDSLSFAAACASLSRQLEAMGDAHELNWWNLL